MCSGVLTRFIIAVHTASHQWQSAECIRRWCAHGGDCWGNSGCPPHPGTWDSQQGCHQGSQLHPTLRAGESGSSYLHLFKTYSVLIGCKSGPCLWGYTGSVVGLAQKGAENSAIFKNCTENVCSSSMKLKEWVCIHVFRGSRWFPVAKN